MHSYFRGNPGAILTFDRDKLLDCAKHGDEVLFAPARVTYDPVAQEQWIEEFIAFALAEIRKLSLSSKDRRTLWGCVLTDLAGCGLRFKDASFEWENETRLVVVVPNDEKAGIEIYKDHRNREYILIRFSPESLISVDYL